MSTERAQPRADLDALCGWSRPPCSPGEAAAADWLAARLWASGCDDVAVVPVLGFPFYAAPFAAEALVRDLAVPVERG